jgi:O-6-methylguanine DNA methyltransferase
MEATEFEKRVWQALCMIPKGKVATYGEVAEFLGSPAAARAVGKAVAKNPMAPEIPCHRIVMSDGSIGGYSAPGGIAAKISLLSEEGINVEEGKIADFSEVRYRFADDQQSVRPSGS